MLCIGIAQNGSIPGSHPSQNGERREQEGTHDRPDTIVTEVRPFVCIAKKIVLQEFQDRTKTNDAGGDRQLSAQSTRP